MRGRRGRFPQPMVWFLRNRRDISAAEVSLSTKWPVSHQPSQPGALVWGRGVPITSGCEKQWNCVWERQRTTRDWDIALEGLLHRLTCSKLQSRDNRSKSARAHTDWLTSGGGVGQESAQQPFPGMEAEKPPLFLCGASSYPNLPAFTCLALDCSTEATYLHSSCSLFQNLSKIHTPQTCSSWPQCILWLLTSGSKPRKSGNLSHIALYVLSGGLNLA